MVARTLTWFAKLAVILRIGKGKHPSRVSNLNGWKTHATATGCSGCGKCRTVCPFLHHYGTPKAIGDNVAYLGQLRDIAYRCSLCGLCNQICPEQLDLTSFFLEMRCSAVSAGLVSWRPYLPILFYERMGLSRLFSLEILPKGCDTVFFPGCALPGAYPGETLRLFHEMRKIRPNLGIVLSCCSKPSHDLGRSAVFEHRFRRLITRLSEKRISSLITACPSCTKIFRTHAPSMQVTTAYHVLDHRRPSSMASAPAKTVTLHDPCVLRRDSETHLAVRSLIASLGYQVEEMQHNRQHTLCCGQGGMVAAIDPSLASTWRKERTAESNGKTTVVYCAGCAASLGEHGSTIHIAQLLADPAGDLHARKHPHPPQTYGNRLLVKRRLRSTNG